MSGELTGFDVVVILAVATLLCAVVIGAADRIMGRADDAAEQLEEQASSDWRFPERQD